MSLTNEQYDSLMREYNSKQMRNNQIVASRTQEVYKAIPSLSALDEEVANVSVSSISALLDGASMEEAKAASSLKLRELREKRASLLKSAGFSPDYLMPPYDCPDCMDTGFLPATKERCHCFKQKAINLVYSQCNIGTILSKENFDSYDLNVYSDDYYEAGSNQSARTIAENAFKEARNFVQNFSTLGGNLLLFGKTGCGKTFLSNCIAKDLLEQGVSVIYFTSFQLFDIFEKKIFRKDVDAADTQDQIFDCDLLIIDDLGTELSNSFTASRLFQCLNERLIRGKSTIISTNLSLKELTDTYSERTTSRIFSNYKYIKLIGEDIRLKKYK